MKVVLVNSTISELTSGTLTRTSFIALGCTFFLAASKWFIVRTCCPASDIVARAADARAVRSAPTNPWAVSPTDRISSSVNWCATPSKSFDKISTLAEGCGTGISISSSNLKNKETKRVIRRLSDIIPGFSAGNRRSRYVSYGFASAPVNETPRPKGVIKVLSVQKVYFGSGRTRRLCCLMGK